MTTAKLPHGVWMYDPDARLGKPGGFGAVYRGQGEDGSPVAVKKLHLRAHDAAHRELRMAEHIRDSTPKHVLPVLDSGLDADSEDYYVVMPIADGSLADELARRGPFTDAEAIQVLSQIAEGLANLRGVVHRDLKP